MSKKVVSQSASTERKSASSVLFPIAAFLKSGGMSRQAAAESFLSAYDRAAKTLKAREVSRIGNYMQYSEVVSLWQRDRRFLDESGRPRPLSMDGKNGFSSLVRLVKYKVEPKKILSVLLRYGSVRKIGEGKYSLTGPFFNSFGSKNFALETHAGVLADLSETPNSTN